jgi:hypothetical protein
LGIDFPQYGEFLDKARGIAPVASTAYLLAIKWLIDNKGGLKKRFAKAATTLAASVHLYRQQQRQLQALPTYLVLSLSLKEPRD